MLSWQCIDATLAPQIARGNDKHQRRAGAATAAASSLSCPATCLIRTGLARLPDARSGATCQLRLCRTDWEGSGALAGVRD